MQEPTYTVKEVAEQQLLGGYKERTIWSLINDGKLGFTDLAGGKNKKRTIRIRESDIKKFLSDRGL